MVRRSRRSSKRGGVDPPVGLTLRTPQGQKELYSKEKQDAAEAEKQARLEADIDKLYQPGGPYGPPLPASTEPAPAPARFIGPIGKPAGPPPPFAIKPKPKGGRRRTRRRHPRRKTSRRKQ